ncbi:MAG: cyclase, partial [Leptolyngbyaceae cyanobacterium MAG.088]|nr:cyclase [Leptolyngbyaceae cyanobacterium MAG.088]
MNQDILGFTTSDQSIDDNCAVQLSDDACKRVSIKTEKCAPRQRQIVASVAIPRSLDQVWNVLTDYERLSDFVPNLTISRLLSHP